MDDAFSFKCSSEWLEHLREAARRRDLSMSEPIRRSVSREIAQRALPLLKEEERENS